ncbi:MAG: hypothetical protein WC783_02240 [Candidatus Paceibacterota bacterium]|jgi:hypothetical protein
MGKNQKIPYLSEVVFYFAKVFILLFVLNFLFSKTFFYNQPLILIFSIFASFSFNIFYLAMIVFGYIISFLVTVIVFGNFGLLVVYLFGILSNTVFMIIFFKYKYKFKEEQ